jgi:hypothetical protein
MKRLFFIVMVGLWGAFVALAIVSPETFAARMAVIVVLAPGWSTMSFPRR